MLESIKVQSVLSGHVSPETAYVVNDYPYGFRLRCQMRYWLEYKPGKGVRLCSQSSNPKVAGLVWNKPKASTYARFGGAMYLDEQEHVQWSGLDEYSSAAEVANWLSVFEKGLPPGADTLAAAWLKAKQNYEAAKEKTLTVEKAKPGVQIQCKAHPEWGTFTLAQDEHGNWSKKNERGESAFDLAGEAHFWTVC